MTRFAGEIHPVADLFPMLSDEDLADLATDIRNRGLMHRIVLDADGRLLDGRNRLAACELAEVEPTFTTYIGTDAVGFVVSENLIRRHLTIGQRAVLALDVLPFYAEQAAQRKTGRPRKGEEKESADRRTHKRAATADAAKATKVSGRAVERAKRIAEQAPDLLEKVKTGMALDRAERVIRDREAEQRDLARVRAEAAAREDLARVDIRTGDFREVLGDLHDINAIITDPPYPAEFLHLYADLAVWADKVLAPDGVLVVLSGQTHLPDVYRLLDGGRPYRWTGAYMTAGSSWVSHPRRVHSNWKPLLVYGSGPRFADVVNAEGVDAGAKENHRWGQDYGAFRTIVERLTAPGQTIVDPFMGAGTTLLAAHALGRHAIGCDVDPVAVATTRQRLGHVEP